MKKHIRAITVLFSIILLSVSCYAYYQYSIRTTLVDYKSVRIKKEAVEVSDKEIQESVDSIMDKYSKEISGKAKEKDEVVLTFKGMIDSKTIINEKEKTITLGKDEISKGFDQKIIGMKKGETKTFSIIYDGSDKTYRSKKIMVTVNIIGVKRIPELTDSFVQEKFGYKDIKSLNSALKSELKKQKEAEATAAEDEKIWDYLMDHTIVRHYDKKDLDNEIKEIDGVYKNMAKKQNLSHKQFINDNFRSKERYQKEIRKEAKKRIKEDIMIRMILEKENVSYTKKQIKQEEQDLYQEYGYRSISEMEKNNTYKEIKKCILKKKVIEIVRKVSGIA